MQRPISLLVCALGGEGGGVLSEWLVEVARRCDHPAQATSIPGVAQRTGATTYYLEFSPQARAQLGGAQPVFSLNAMPGALDAVIASELLEAARCASGGLPSPDRTLFIASSSRTLTTTERSHPADGRLDNSRLLDIVAAASRSHHLLDMAAIARAHGTVVSAVMFGALAGSGLLPFPREAFEAVLRHSGRGADASLAGFAQAYQTVRAGRQIAGLAESSARKATARGLPPEAADLPAVLHEIVTLGHARVCEYQNRRYGDLYLQRVRRVLDAERLADPVGTQSLAATREAARWLALWMSYEDIARVAELKSRASRFERVRRETRALDRELLRVHDHFKPGIDEIAALLPPSLAKRLQAWGRRHAARHGEAWAMPVRLATHTIGGLLVLRLLAACRHLRRFGSRHAQEQALIEEWLSAVTNALAAGWSLGREVAACGRLVKGYGSTHAQAMSNFLHLVRHVAADPGLDPLARAHALRTAREAAQADDAGKALDRALRDAGAPPRPVREQAIRWMPRQARRTG